MSPKKNKKRSGRKGRSHAYNSGPLHEFFSEYYPQFEYDATESASREFYRLCDEFDWDRDDPDREVAHRKFKDALVQQFNQAYGTDESNLADWQNLCCILHIDPTPDDLGDCQEAVRQTHVNLVDLVDRDITGEDARIFDTERDLSLYTKNTGKYFPKENAYAGGLLRHLLRHIIHPASD